MADILNNVTVVHELVMAITGEAERIELLERKVYKWTPCRNVPVDTACEESFSAGCILMQAVKIHVNNTATYIVGINNAHQQADQTVMDNILIAVP